MLALIENYIRCSEFLVKLYYSVWTVRFRLCQMYNILYKIYVFIVHGMNLLVTSDSLTCRPNLHNLLLNVFLVEQI